MCSTGGVISDTWKGYLRRDFERLRLFVARFVAYRLAAAFIALSTVLDGRFLALDFARRICASSSPSRNIRNAIAFACRSPNPSALSFETLRVIA